MVTRDMLQGFIDGYSASGADQTILPQIVHDYLTAHPSFPLTNLDAYKVVSDLNTFRLTDRATLVPRMASTFQPPSVRMVLG